MLYRPVMINYVKVNHRREKTHTDYWQICMRKPFTAAVL